MEYEKTRQVQTQRALVQAFGCREPVEYFSAATVKTRMELLLRFLFEQAVDDRLSWLVSGFFRFRVCPVESDEHYIVLSTLKDHLPSLCQLCPSNVLLRAVRAPEATTAPPVAATEASIPQDPTRQTASAAAGAIAKLEAKAEAKSPEQLLGY